MGYVYTGPPPAPPKKGQPAPPPQFVASFVPEPGLGRYTRDLQNFVLGDTCTITPSGARVCTSDSAPPASVTPVSQPASCPPCPPPPACPPQMACPDPVCPPVPTCPPQRACPPWGGPTTMPVRPPYIPTPIARPTPMPLPPVIKPVGTVTPVAKTTSISAAAAIARARLLAGAGRARMLEGLGDECQVYANGARVCNAPGPAGGPSTPPTPTPGTLGPLVCTNEPITGPVWATGVMTQRMPYGPSGNIQYLPPARTIGTRRVCRRVPAAIAATQATAATAYTTSTVAPIVPGTPAAPVPEGSSAESAGGFEFPSIPSWVWYVILGGGAYLLFFRNR